MTAYPDPSQPERPLRVVYVAVRDAAEAERLGEGAVRRKLAACASHWPIQSTYWWNGKLERSTEQAVLLRTSGKRLGALFTWLAREHSYEVPDIVELSVSRVHEPYLNWLLSIVEGPPARASRANPRPRRRGAPKGREAPARPRTRALRRPRY